MEKDYFRYYKPKFLLFTIIILSIIYGYALNIITSFINDILKEPYVYFPTISTLIILTLFLIDKYGLKKPFLKHLFWVKDISGRYEGIIRYKHFEKIDVEETKNCFVEIEQSASKISVKTYFNFKDDNKTDEKTSSKSLVTSIIASDEFDNQKLVFTYQNEGNSLKGLPPSNGTNILSIIEKDNTIYLKGVYYTDKTPQTKGEMEVNLISKKLKKEF